MSSANLTSGVFTQVFNEVQEQKKAAIYWIKEVTYRSEDVKRLYLVDYHLYRVFLVVH